MLYMLDTNICIYMMNQKTPNLTHRLIQLKKGEAVMSVVTYAEIRAGIEIRSTHQEADEKVLNKITQLLPVLPFDMSAAHAYGQLRSLIQDRKRNSLDRLIGAHALSCGATLVTHNTADFADYPNLKIEDWMVLH